MTVITMSRQWGSGAEEVANRLCQEMGLRVFDKGLMMRVATEVGFSDTQIVDYSEEQYELRNFLDVLFRRARTVAEVSTRVRTGNGPDTVDTLILNEARAIDLIRTTMHAAHERGDVLIIGRGGQAILEDKPDVLHVRIVAPLEQRITRVQNWEQCTAPQARRLVTERDRATHEYLRTFHSIEVDDATLYHLVLNTGKLDMVQCVDVIKRAALAITKPAAAVAAA
jgi:CMP/dCMP kinase